MITLEEEKRIEKTIKKVIDDNPDIVNKYKKGQKGLIGFLMKKIIKESTISFYSKSSKQKLVVMLKNNLI